MDCGDAARDAASPVMGGDGSLMATANGPNCEISGATRATTPLSHSFSIRHPELSVSTAGLSFVVSRTLLDRWGISSADINMGQLRSASVRKRLTF